MAAGEEPLLEPPLAATPPAAQPIIVAPPPKYEDLKPAESIVPSYEEVAIGVIFTENKTIGQARKLDLSRVLPKMMSATCGNNSILFKKIVVSVALCLVAQALSSVNMINSGFLAVHFTGRNISGAVSGLVGSGVGLGYMVSPALNIFGRLHFDRQIPVRVLLQALMLIYVVKCAAYAFSDHIVHSAVFSGISVTVRVFSGVVSYMWAMSLVEAIRQWLPDHFQLVSSLVLGTGGYVGYAVGSFVGTLSYEELGFHGPYLIVGVYVFLILILIRLILPHDTKPISNFERLREPVLEKHDLAYPDTTGAPVAEDDLSPMVLAPLLCQMVVNMTGGYFSMVTVPFLIECCSVSATQGSSMITAYSLTLAVGFFIAGVVSQRRALSPTAQAILGAIMVALGPCIMFPSPTLTALYSNSQYIGYLAIVLFGVGDPLVVSVTVCQMESVQTELYGRTLSPKQSSRIASFWLAGWIFGYYAGMFIAGVLMELVSFEVGGWIMASLSLLSVCVTAALKLAIWWKKKKRAEKISPVV